MKTKSFLILLGGALLAGTSPWAFAMQKADAPAAAAGPRASVNSGTSVSQQASTGADEVLKLVKSGVDESVILEFVRSSRGPYQLDADDIIALRDQGVSPAVITAMLQRGAELRASAPQPSAATAMPVAPAAAPAPAVTPPVTTYYVPGGAYAPSVSSVVYIPSYPSYTYSYYVPSYYAYGGCYYPRYRCYYPYYPSFSFYYGRPHYSVGVGFGYGGFRVGGFYGGHYRGHFGGFHGGFRHCR